MRTSRAKTVLLSALLAVAAAVEAPAQGAGAGRPAVVLIPARYTLVQLGFDIAQMRSIFLCSYQPTATVADGVVIHAWDGSAWQEIPLANYRVANCFNTTPGKTVIVAEQPAVADLLSAASAWSADVLMIRSLDLGVVVEGLNEALDLSGREIEWLAARYRLTVEDVNRDRRRYGRYGRPGARPSAMERSTMTAFPSAQGGFEAPLEGPATAPAAATDDVLNPVPVAPAEGPLPEDK